MQSIIFNSRPLSLKYYSLSRLYNSNPTWRINPYRFRISKIGTNVSPKLFRLAKSIYHFQTLEIKHKRNRYFGWLLIHEILRCHCLCVNHKSFTFEEEKLLWQGGKSTEMLGEACRDICIRKIVYHSQEFFTSYFPDVRSTAGPVNFKKEHRSR